MTSKIRGSRPFVNYDSWNKVLSEYLFNSKNKNKIVYIYVNEELIKKLGSKLDINDNEALSSFCKSVLSYSEKDPNLLFEKAYIWGRKWFKQGMVGYPPFIGVLAITVLAATKMKVNREKGIGAGNYYFRLRNLLRLNGQGKPFGFEKTRYLWSYLISWQKENKGTFGYSNVFRYGQAYIGYPMSQCLIRDADREQLYEFFYWAGLRPGIEVDSNTLMEQLELFLSTKVSRLARRFFNKKKGIKEAIIKAILFEFQNWDGTNNNLSNRKSNLESLEKIKVNKYNLFLRINEDKHKNFFNPKLTIGFFAVVEEDIISNENFDIENLDKFKYKNNTLYREINLIDDRILINKQTFSLLNSQLELIFNGGEIFFFHRGTDLGIDGWINRDSIIKGKDHLILYRAGKESDVLKWIELNEFLSKEIPLSTTSYSWKCRLVKVNNSEIIGTQELDTKLIIDQARDKITFQEGLKVGNMEWLLEAPPKVSIITLPKTIVSINDIPILCLINGEDTIDFKNLHLKESQIYRISFNNTEKTILLKNNHENLITFNDFKPKEYSDGNLRIAGTYIYDSLESYPRPYKQKGNKAFLYTESKNDIKYIPNFINAMPFNMNRTHKELGVSYCNGYLNQVRAIDLFFEYLTIRKRGNWDAFIKGIKWCFGSENTALIAYKVRKKLSQLGFIEFMRDRDTNKFFWEVIPTSIAVIPSNDPIVYLTGGRTREYIRKLNNLIEGEIRLIGSVPKSTYEPITVYLLGDTVESLSETFNTLNIKYNWGLDYFSYDLLRCLPSLSSYINSAYEFQEPRSTNTYWTVKGWDLFSHKWANDKDSPLKLYLDNIGQSICLYKTPYNKTIKLDRELGKLYFAQQQGIRLFQYSNYELKVKLAYELPELYERVLTSCLGQCPEVENGYRKYRNVPHEIAIALAYKLGFELILNR